MGKRPSFQFYPDDWLADESLMSCSLAAQGLWAQFMARMHRGHPYGYLTNARRKGFLKNPLARLVGVSVSELEGLMAELEEAGVPGITEEGTWFSRRMVRDEEVRQARAEGGKLGAKHGKKGGRPRGPGVGKGTPEGVNKNPLDPLGRGYENNPPPSPSPSPSPKEQQQPHDPTTTDPVAVTHADECRELDQLRRQGPGKYPHTRECLTCGALWALRPGKNGSSPWYGHGADGHLGCIATCPAPLYEQKAKVKQLESEAAAAPKQPKPYKCSTCSELITEGDYCPDCQRIADEREL
jgi:hypothetical protein